MSGHKYDEAAPEVSCPYCEGKCYAEYCDIGVGFQQITPHVCEECNAVEIGPYDEPRELSAKELETQFYDPTPQDATE